ncbi:MAG: FAD-dependent oxidoreductase [Bacteroidales bacterium]|nr:FAD-dependent oxidoreductase [Bacteroidales bacterium]
MNQEANRCLLCKNARCSAACAVRTDVPAAMRAYREGRLEDAARMLFENNPFSAITCQVCDWDRMCYGHCVLNAKKVPVRWYEIEKEISAPYLETVSITPGEPAGKTAAILGGGPAGIAAAIFLRKAGWAVRLYDAHEKIGGVLRYGIPAFRLDKSYVDSYERILKEAGVEILTGKKVSLAEVRGTADAVLVTAGAEKAKKMRIPGEDDGRVVTALEYLEYPERFSINGKVMVVGGGNVAMDACRTANRAGCDTTVYYRKTFADMPANTREVEEARQEGVAFQILQVPVAVEVREDGKRVAIVRNCENYFDDKGKLTTRILDGTDHEVPFDWMITAVSESVDYGLLESMVPEKDEWGWLKADEFGRTSYPDVFLAGDFLLGPKTVVQAVASAKKAVEGILGDR